MTVAQIQIAPSFEDQALTHGLYSVKKRLLLPRWWLKGVFCTSKEKSALCHAYFLNRSTGLVAGISMPNLKVFYSVAQFWNQVTKQMMLSEKVAQGSLVTIPINELFSGTRTDQYATFEFFRQAVTTPFCFQFSKGSASSNSKLSGRLGGAGSHQAAFAGFLTTSLLRKLELNLDGCVVAEFLSSVRSVVEGSCFEALKIPTGSFAFEPDADPLVVTLNPSVLKWYGEKTSIGKLALYLFIELEKNRHIQKSAEGFFAMFKDLPAHYAQEFFKELMSKASGLYDHGVLGWNDGAPHGRVADYLPSVTAQGARPLGCVQVLPLSDHLAAVARFEQAIDEKYFARQRQPEFTDSLTILDAVKGRLRQMPERLEGPPLQTAVKGGGRRALLRRIAQKSSCGFAAENEHRFPRSYRNSSEKSFSHKIARESESKPRDQEKEYVLKLAQYYESLSPSQRRDLDFEMKMRSPAEFKEWLRPILERLH